MTQPLNSQKAADLIETKTGRRCSRQNMEKLCRAGRLPISCISSKPIRLNPETLVEEYLRNIDARQQSAAMLTPVPVVADERQLRRAINALPDDAIPELNESRARREHYQAELAKLQVAQQRRELVPADEVKKEAFAMGRSIREALANLADRLSHQLAGETDPTVIHQLLSDEHRDALLVMAEVEA